MRIREKPKIVCTLGTTTDDKEVLRKMVRYGMNCARFNTAYASIEEYSRRIADLRSIARVPIMMDLKGPQIRLKADYNARVQEGDVITIGFGREPFHFTKDFYDSLELEDKVLFENGTIETTVCKKNHFNKRVHLAVEKAGDGNFHKDMGVNIPGRYIDVERLSKKDKQVIDFSIKNNVEYLALSFVRDRSDVANLYEHIRRRTAELKGTNYSNEIGIVAKIEDKNGIDNLESILQYANSKKMNFSIMIARGDMHVELPIHKIPMYQKNIIGRCKEYGVKVVTATGFLESMTKQDKPTRAEVSDAANAVLDGSDALMLSGETSNSEYPAEAVQMLSTIMKEYKR